MMSGDTLARTAEEASAEVEFCCVLDGADVARQREALLPYSLISQPFALSWPIARGSSPACGLVSRSFGYVWSYPKRRTVKAAALHRQLLQVRERAPLCRDAACELVRVFNVS